MSLTLEQMMGGLTPEHDLFFAQKPDNPDMRESTSVWLYEENGAFAFPRVGIEAEASSWDNRRVQGNFAVAGGRILNGAGMGAAHSPFGADGRPTTLGAGPIAFHCIEPFRKWRMTWDGSAIDGTVEQQIAKTLDPNKRTPLRFDVELEMVTPAWVQDLSPEKVAQMSAADAIEAANMGIGWRFEQLFRARGFFSIDGKALQIDGKNREFKGVGLRIKRQSVRPLAGFRGHCWQSAVFPDGRAFGYITYPPREDGKALNEGYIFQNGKMYPARAVKIPWLRRIIGEGDDASLELESDLGITRIKGVTALSTFRVGNPDIGGLNLQQGGVRYTWDDQTAYGMIERSSHESLTTIG
ncbi:MAG TPA: hypothetical protein VFM32_02560 [Spongiibacteraceae bacterium]|nr:hypothetical protein [Spongiibacteraceae bacterium]